MYQSLKVRKYLKGEDTGDVYVQSGCRFTKRRSQPPPRLRADWFACPTTDDQPTRVIVSRTCPARNRFHRENLYLEKLDRL